MPQPIPRPPGVPLLGNIFNITPSNTWASLNKLSEEYGEIFQITVLGHTIVFVGSVALTEELCDQKRFRKYVGGPIVEIRAAVHDALFTAFENESSWGIAHRIIAPHLSPEALGQQNFTEMRDLANELFAKWKNLEANTVISPLSELQRLDLETVTLTLFGQKLNCLEGPEHPMLKGMEDSTSEAMMRPTRLSLVNWLVYRNKFNKSIQTMRRYAADVVEHRKDNPTTRQDVLTAMMNNEDPETKKKLTDSQIIDEIVSMPIGSSTAPCLLTSAILLLLRNPDVISRARREIDAVVGAGDISIEQLDELKYVQAIVRESLRLSSPAPGFNIEPLPSDSKAPVQLAGGKYQVAHNQPMIIVLAGVNRDPTVFEDPLAFKPERMMGEQFERLPEGAKKWFGNGKRECIGKHHAWQWSVLVLAMMLQKVDFEMADPEYKLEKDGWFNVRPIGFKTKVKPRE
ncbi:cytochrome P450 [Metarhizium robertsii]|uniref:Cytochrome P450 CYP541A4 n=2 Tax=Metarhizium robertsii TaxID=568076 RepID=E9EQ83_METRA|nr:Cytochrome P450 CYP541A4 [Metarhizium robertsii ARSEF 23]EFZ02758.1 Cytochrome P450 CYP541A4 [Metarhizium robertsii ARSEF 23]EXV05986.1 cytochrome P450 [Metarhizium robertsii]